MLKNIIFDVGDVLLEYRWKEMLMEHGLAEAEALRVGNRIFASSLWREGLDMGIMTQEEVIAGYWRQMPEDGDAIEWFIRHGELMHVGRPEIWEKVRRLKGQEYGIYLLSNYSGELFRKHTKDADFMKVIDGKVVSYQIHKMKPDAEIYQHLLDTYGLEPEECLFFDDREENVEAAEKLGIQAMQVTSREMLGAELDHLIENKSRRS